MTDSSNIDKGRFSEKMNKKSCRYLWNVNTPTPNNKLTRELSFSHFLVTFDRRKLQRNLTKNYPNNEWKTFLVYAVRVCLQNKATLKRQKPSLVALVQCDLTSSTKVTPFNSKDPHHRGLRSELGWTWHLFHGKRDPVAAVLQMNLFRLRPPPQVAVGLHPRAGGDILCLFKGHAKVWPQHDNWSRFREIKMCGFWLRA